MTVCRVMTWRCALLSAILLAITYSMAEIACRQNLFGPRCQYKCHCAAIVDCPSCNRCNSDGECSGGTVCEPGWFGPECQYVDMANTSAMVTFANGTKLSVLTDGDDQSCLSPSRRTVMNLRWNESFPFTWLRLHVNRPDAIHNITVEFPSNGPQPHECNNPRNATVNGSSLDVYCDEHVPINAIKLRGNGVQALCSVYVSGGRNLALLGNATQSSNFNEDYAKKAVDGNRDSDLIKGNSCSHTDIYKKSATWSIYFSRPQQINRVRLYNRVDCCGERLQGFILTASSRDNKTLSYQDNTSQSQAVYHLTFYTNNRQISRVSIEAKHKDPKYDFIVTLCEVELYGDTVCPVGTYGRDCEKTCNCSGECFVSTGGCPAGCPAGYQGENCITLCSNGYYGVNCKDACSPHCGQNGDCRAVDGECVHGCEAGYTNPTCNESCSNGYFGVNCKDTCSPHCGQNGDCRAVDGVCVHGCETGYINPTCNDSCSNGYYGANCKDTCSPHCGQNGDCRAVDGVCVHGCEAGYLNPTCNDTCGYELYGLGCSNNCSRKCVHDGGRVCEPISGKCLAGCRTNYNGSECQVVPTADPQQDPSPAGAVIGSVVAVILVVAAVIIAFICWRRRRYSTSDGISTSENISIDNSNEGDSNSFPEDKM